LMKCLSSNIVAIIHRRMGSPSSAIAKFSPADSNRHMPQLNIWK
jgi:hypothetical protein